MLDFSKVFNIVYLAATGVVILALLFECVFMTAAKRRARKGGDAVVMILNCIALAVGVLLAAALIMYKFDLFGLRLQADNTSILLTVKGNTVVTVPHLGAVLKTFDAAIGIVVAVALLLLSLYAVVVLSLKSKKRRLSAYEQSNLNNIETEPLTEAPQEPAAEAMQTIQSLQTEEIIEAVSTDKEQEPLPQTEDKQFIQDETVLTEVIPEKEKDWTVEETHNPDLIETDAMTYFNEETHVTEKYVQRNLFEELNSLFDERIQSDTAPQSKLEHSALPPLESRSENVGESQTAAVKKDVYTDKTVTEPPVDDDVQLGEGSFKNHKSEPVKDSAEKESAPKAKMQDTDVRAELNKASADISVSAKDVRLSVKNVTKRPPIKSIKSEIIGEETIRSGVEPVKKESELPVTKRHIIINKRSAVNLFKDYLNGKSNEDKDKLENSISTILLK